MPPTLDDLRRQLAAIPPVAYPLDETEEAAVDHSYRLGEVAAICCEAFRRYGLTAVLVGGGVIEFVLPGAYTTPDIDLVIAQRWLRPPRPLVADVFAALGFTWNGARHWVRGGWYVEVPDHDITDPTKLVTVAGHAMEMVLPEVVLVGRMVEYDQTGHTGHATQALLMLDILGPTLNEPELQRMARTERVVDVLASLRELLTLQPRPVVTDSLLQERREAYRAQRYHARPRNPDDAVSS